MRTGVIFIVGCVASLVAGHGSMSFPQPRNQKVTHYCPHCANGPDVCGSGGNSQWPATSDASLWSSTYTTDLLRLTAGGTLDVEYYLMQPHFGHFVMEICYYDGSSTTIEDSCFQRLERDPSTTTYSPYNPNRPALAYFPQDSCAKNYNNPNNAMKTRFKIPAQTAAKAVLRWYWQTGNSCLNDESVRTSTMDSALANWRLDSCTVASSNHALCGTDCPNSSCRFEQFKNCADVMVVADGPTNVDKSNAVTGGDPGADTTTTTTRRTTTTTRRTTTTTTRRTTTTTRRPTSTTTTTTTTTPPHHTTTENNGGNPNCTLPPACYETEPEAGAETEPEAGPVTEPEAGAETEPEAGAETTQCPHHGNPVEHCKMVIKGSAEWYDVICEEQCEVFADTQENYCRGEGFEMNADGLIDCIIASYPTLCRRT